ncbi:DUF805 domain-containing protein [Apilactobacillus micheneri]|uniref:DUF805 domain-containing protein n=1 Tax=Apilactobacillus micheneri TaxID=1899430 RepID=A0ABY2Z0C0_9LACO|nr:DUF805 domain-containing protein [Apilactobacillus micheneri]TPR24483.1 DUF805 domain-containing protein [Apilactobacillus micheneri]TPR25794.1 DUF805 domain-containing protein [Apilactobacillus micheneri]TPR27984.1 DUF805 domain-containing protein [Apilactobacillus micheneri]TPR29475.1 DUF805 domain-containing protein [Apilactobacillus micheneri]TPR30261.1 DUF805 domain-containing protein [Apilactobacillus micheneri]
MNNEEMENHNLITAFKKMWSNMFYIEGKTERVDFWLGYVTIAIIDLLFFTLVLGTNSSLWSVILYSIVSAFGLIMTFTAAIRRLHDANFSAHFLWLLLIPIFGIIIVFILLVTPKSDENRHAPSTKPAGMKWESNILNWLIIIVTALALFGINELISNAANSSNNKIDVSNTSDNEDSSSSDSSSSSQSSSSSSESSSESSSSEESSSSSSDEDNDKHDDDDNDDQDQSDDNQDEDKDKNNDDQDQEDQNAASEQSSSSEDNNKENTDNHDDQDKSDNQSNDDNNKQDNNDQQKQEDNKQTDNQSNEQSKPNDDQNKQQSQNESSNQQENQNSNASSSSSK